MGDPPLSIPIFIDSSHPASSSDPLPVNAKHIASWSTSSQAGPSRQVALAAHDNTIWIHTSPIHPVSPSVSSVPVTHPVPIITTSGSSTPTKTRAPSTRHASFAGRTRTDSSASSILTSSSGRQRKISTFSPPPTGKQLPTATLTSAIASTSSDGHIHRGSVSGRVDLREHLREQGKERDEDRGLGLGLVGLGRRGLIGVHGKEDHESGATSPLSAASVESARAVPNRWSWLRGGEGVGKERGKELNEKMEEVEVEREMEREVREEVKESEDRRAVEMAGVKSTPRFPDEASPKPNNPPIQAMRIILPQPGRGTIACLRVFKEIGLLGILRDEGLLDLISLSTLDLVGSIQVEEPESKNETGPSKTPRLSPFWSWRGIHLVASGKHSMIVIDGLPWPCSLPSPNGEVTRVIMITSNAGQWDIVSRLELPGLGHVELCKNDKTWFLLHFLSFSLTSYPIRFAKPATAPPTRFATPAPRAISTAFSTKPLRSSTPSPVGPDIEPSLRRNRSMASLTDDTTKEKTDKGFAKFLAVRRGQPPVHVDLDEGIKAGIDEGKEVERDGYGDWTLVRVDEDGNGIGVSADAVDVFRCDGQTLTVRSSIPLAAKTSVNDAVCADRFQTIFLATKNRLQGYQRESADDRIKYNRRFDIPSVKAICIGEEAEIVLADEKYLSTMDPRRLNANPTRLVGLAPMKRGAKSEMVYPSGTYDAYVANVEGTIHEQSLADVLIGRPPSSQTMDVDRHESPVSCMRLLKWQQDDLLVAGDEDGVIRIWKSSPMELQGSWTVFADPVHWITMLDMPLAGVLRNCVLCTSKEGTIALISLADMDHLFLIPASRAPLRRIFLDGRDILLAYANGKARVWNVETCEFRRSTGVDAGDDMLQSANWIEVDMDARSTSDVFTPLWANVPSASDIGCLVNLDVRNLYKWVHSSRMSSTPLALVRVALSMIMTFGIDNKIDEICTTKLGITRPTVNVSMGEVIGERGVRLQGLNGPSSWNISPQASGLRQLAIVSLLRPFLDAPDLESWAAEVIAFYSGSLSTTIQPDLEFFADFYMDSAGDVHQAARMSFESRLGRMTNEEIEKLVNEHQAYFPSLQSPDGQHDPTAVKALTIVGGAALHKYQSISPTALKAASESISIYLSNRTSPHLALAIELASKGFSTWQTYIDPMELLRLLFHLSTHTPPSPSLSAQARLAVLHVALLSPALFMSTLSMDILDAKTVEGRTSIMKLCVFMARKRPAVLENGLSRIAESIVKSLDPNIGKMRDDVWEAATVILNELVLAFSTIDFHSGTQRLAVGTHEGAVIMYDLKTASRLYIIEPHQSAVSSVTFSPDGRRLVTVSLEDGDVTVWKVGSSLSGFFNVGAPPRQGGEKGGPFKRIVFKRADDGPLEETSALSDVKVEWPGQRQARVMIRETALTFET